MVVIIYIFISLFDSNNNNNDDNPVTLPYKNCQNASLSYGLCQLAIGHIHIFPMPLTTKATIIKPTK